MNHTAGTPLSAPGDFAETMLDRPPSPARARLSACRIPAPRPPRAGIRRALRRGATLRPSLIPQPRLEAAYRADGDRDTTK
jgi:hypothetical protein